MERQQRGRSGAFAQKETGTEIRSSSKLGEATSYQLSGKYGQIWWAGEVPNVLQSHLFGSFKVEMVTVHHLFVNP
jgi:hypothetical protein